MATSWSFQDDVHIEYDSEARIAKEYVPGASEPTVVRPFNDEENARAEAAERLAIVTAESQAKAELQEAIVAAIAATTTNKPGGGAWVRPTGAHDAYAKDAEVTHNGKTWVSLTPYNVWEPGGAGWREVVSEGYPAWVQPVGAVDAYALGARVSHNGQNWENTGSAANVWEPGVFGWIVIP